MFRDLTQQEMNALYVRGVCPACGSEEFRSGPAGGIMHNVKCSKCPTTFNVVEGAIGKGAIGLPLGQMLYSEPDYVQKFGGTTVVGGLLKQLVRGVPMPRSLTNLVRRNK